MQSCSANKVVLGMAIKQCLKILGRILFQNKAELRRNAKSTV